MEAELRAFLTSSLVGVSGRFQAPKAPRIIQAGGRLGVTTEGKLNVVTSKHLYKNTNRKTANFCNGEKYLMLKFRAFVGISW
jgi:hypothetical protein